MTATIPDVHNNASETIYITADIGPGPNSTAFLISEGAILYPQERNALRQLLSATQHGGIISSVFVVSADPPLAYRLFQSPAGFTGVLTGARSKR